MTTREKIRWRSERLKKSRSDPEEPGTAEERNKSDQIRAKFNIQAGELRRTVRDEQCRPENMSSGAQQHGHGNFNCDSNTARSSC